VVFNGTGAAPRAATVKCYQETGGIPNHGPLSVSVPGRVAGLGAMHAAFGSRPWASLFGAAIEAARGVPIGAEDLASTEAERQAPIAVPYRGYTVAQTPPNSTGFTLLQMLRIVARFDLAALGWHTPR
jgi:gamma-glutamyltranspeptidase/glutathione hydrolase